MRKRIFRIIQSIFGPLVLVGVTTLGLDAAYSILNVQNIALIYLIPVMLSTAFWGMVPGLLAGFISFLAFNYFFVKPYNTLLVHQSQDLITLVIFIVVSIVISEFVGQARKSAVVAKMKESEATKMYELLSAFSEANNISAVAESLARQLVSTFGFAYCEVETDDLVQSQKSIGAFPTGEVHTQPPDLTIDMVTQREKEGVVRIWYSNHEFAEDEERLAKAFIAQGALTIERIKLTANETRLQILDQSDRLKTSLLNSVSHELRTPLAAIKASISSLTGGTVAWADVSVRQDLLTMIEEETDRLNLLVGNLLDMSRIESGSLQPHLHWNSISEIAKSASMKMDSQLQNNSIEFSLPDDLPLIPSDYVLLEQVFTNLISNSVKYAPPNSVIKISSSVTDGMLMVKVLNQSPKVEERDLEHIFEKFYRVTQSDKVLGTGLGLSICKGIIEAHGGKIWAENSSDGFLFVFTLPLTMNGLLPSIPEESSNG